VEHDELTALRAKNHPNVERKKRQRRKTAQMIVRMDPEQKAFLEKAAAASGRTLAELMTECAREKAVQIFREEEEITRWRLARGFDRLC
jgi:uncharacterized protein (DUF1778 family)